MLRDLIISNSHEYDELNVASHNDKGFWKSPEVSMERRIQKFIAETPDTPELHNLAMVCVNKDYLENRVLYLNTGIVDYFHHIYTREEKDFAKRANPLYAAAIAVDKDGKLIGGRSRDVEIESGKINIPSGAVNPFIDAPRNGKPCVYGAMCREFAEEFGIFPESFSSVELGPMIRDEKYPHPSQIYEIKLNLSSDQVRKHFDANNERKRILGQQIELDELLSFDWSEEGLGEAISGDELHLRVKNTFQLYGSGLIKPKIEFD